MEQGGQPELLGTNADEGRRGVHLALCARRMTTGGGQVVTV